jgi:hypothetical protein
MLASRSTRLFVAVLVALLLLIPAASALADHHGGASATMMADGDDMEHPAETGPAEPPPIPIIAPRVSPPPIPHTSVLNPFTIYNNLLVPGKLPQPSVEADAADGGRFQEAPGRFIRQNGNRPVVIDGRDAARGLTLYPQENVCNSFDTSTQWASMAPPSATPRADIWTDWYGGWAPFAIDDGLYQAKNLTFSLERSVGPGKNYGSGYSAKIASNQPYAGGFGSPMIKVDPLSVVTVKVNYLIADHNDHGMDYDWASMGIKPDATGEGASYVNGYVRGEWAQLEHTVWAGESGYIMVLLQGSSPGALNSNIYFDDVRITVNDKSIAKCIIEEDTN